MLSVIVTIGDKAEELPGLLTALTGAAVEGLVREVLIAGVGPSELLQALRDETGAELAQDLREAIGQARSDLVLVLPAAFRPKAGWTEALAAHLRDGGREAVLTGGGGGFLRRAPRGLLVSRAAALRAGADDVRALRRSLRRRGSRLS